MQELHWALCRSIFHTSWKCSEAVEILLCVFCVFTVYFPRESLRIKNLFSVSLILEADFQCVWLSFFFVICLIYHPGKQQNLCSLCAVFLCQLPRSLNDCTRLQSERGQKGSNPKHGQLSSLWWSIRTSAILKPWYGKAGWVGRWLMLWFSLLWSQATNPSCPQQYERQGQDGNWSFRN